MKATEIKAQDVKLQEGKRYRRRDGQITGPLMKILSDITWKVYHVDPDTRCLYWNHGSYQLSENSPEDLLQELDIITINEQGDELPDAAYFVTSPKDMASMQATIDLQSDKIKKLQAAIDRKNKIFSEVMDMVRYELAKEIE